ncbi:hypothetical protein HS041_32785 [Planomonospora sp. ID67723]|uniref:hypothetical protein n=1 Tax=Planomonospora sp. ID67723 TaxID=2738134 RepID=UPI0018C39DDD|nr:hypothetical protein [Planomonospora sp. ID67723]MBG0832483.1 hypothetical protein [Planomonospora sp. ID67723]
MSAITVMTGAGVSTASGAPARTAEPNPARLAPVEPEKTGKLDRLLIRLAGEHRPPLGMPSRATGNTKAQVGCRDLGLRTVRRQGLEPRTR